MKKFIILAVLFLIIFTTYISTTSEQGDTIVSKYGKVPNLNRLERFMENTQSGIKDKVQVVGYTLEGAPIFHDINFDGEKIEVTFDNSLDGFAGGERGKSSFQCTGIRSENSFLEKNYHLKGCFIVSEGKRIDLHLASYEKYHDLLRLVGIFEDVY